MQLAYVYVSSNTVNSSTYPTFHSQPRMSTNASIPTSYFICYHPQRPRATRRQHYDFAVSLTADVCFHLTHPKPSSNSTFRSLNFVPPAPKSHKTLTTLLTTLLRTDTPARDFPPRTFDSEHGDVRTRKPQVLYW